MKKEKKQKIEKNVEKYNDFSNVSEPEIFNPSEIFNQENGGDNQSNVAKELFNPKNPKIKTEIVDNEDINISRLYALSRRVYEPRNIYLLKDALDEFVLFRMSKNRGSRKEFVETHREIRKDNQNGLMDKLLGNNNNIIK